MTHATLAAMLLLLAATWQCDGAQRVHERLSDSEIRRVFRVASREEVPQYELVQLRARRHQRSEREVGGGGDRKAVSLRAFGRRFDLRLKRNRDFEQRAARLQVLAAESTPNGLAYTPLRAKDEEVPDDLWSRAGAYQDHTNMAALVLSQDKLGHLRMEGTLGEDLAISPLPTRLNVSADETYYDARGNADDEGFLDEDDASPRHVVFKRPGSSESSSTFGTGGDAKGDPLSDYAHLDDAFFRYRIVRNRTSTTAPPPLQKLGHKSRRRRASDPDTVWPEILLIVDYDTYLLHGRSHTDIKRYLVSFWNGVDLRYRLLSSPRVKISLAGMIVAKDRDATPYLERNRLRAPNEDAIDVAGALTDMGKYLYREDRLPTYDLAVVVTKLDMCRRHLEGGRCNRGTAGFAYVGGACVVNKRLEKVNSVAIIEDSGGFSGIIVAAHEVGHLLGCVHDGSPAPGYLGGPGAQRCPWEDGFIMSDLRHTERGFRWSSCSVQQFRHFLLGETASCLYNYPHENQLLARMLPGSMLSLDDQCRRDRGTTACFKDSRVCAQLFCYDSSSGYCVSYRPAAEGSPCGDGQTCKNGRCIAEIENIIPDYTHVTPSFASGRSVGGRGGGADVARRRADFSAEVVDGPRPHLMPAPPPPPPPSHHPSVSRSRHPQHLRPAHHPRTTRKPRALVANDKGCVGDSTELIAGRMTCAQFLEQFGNRYCNHGYIQRHCCYSQSLYCS
ncbi:A disintegrin and metalloproteinase with thrombospondin motifs 16 [Rhipicephalus sanguineus]|uniref:A disintegrin and metalloproteinase with thrombospondin motifs 16 n=1 Tax=Rhipicephalus sanguineus TaxID=34632 RepID=UPI0018937DD6|nr:A disintegrin and metalloproteinase with thrombospondin motifs 16 [Rhipicephalus sanguineus]XP_037529582.1 A disintegrin and metalloproteinase with thrombospondin motifs 16 [Rhipicephalus sanguineus]XP_049275971.1 A disintegrin and metalloproteinase with thrombospondin motifs 16 [Rhipicephalus sanguineus]